MKRARNLHSNVTQVLGRQQKRLGSWKTISEVTKIIQTNRSYRKTNNYLKCFTFVFTYTHIQHDQDFAYKKEASPELNNRY